MELGFFENAASVFPVTQFPHQVQFEPPLSINSITHVFVLASQILA